jgi:hypothetical protein
LGVLTQEEEGGEEIGTPSRNKDTLATIQKEAKERERSITEELAVG